MTQMKSCVVMNGSKLVVRNRNQSTAVQREFGWFFVFVVKVLRLMIIALFCLPVHSALVYPI